MGAEGKRGKGMRGERGGDGRGWRDRGVGVGRKRRWLTHSHEQQGGIKPKT